MTDEKHIKLVNIKQLIKDDNDQQLFKQCISLLENTDEHQLKQGLKKAFDHVMQELLEDEQQEQSTILIKKDSS